MPVYVGGHETPSLSSLYSTDSYIRVQRSNDPTTNGARLFSAYTLAKSLTPGGNALADDNRVTIMLDPGVYDIGSNLLVMDTDYIDILGSGVARADYSQAYSFTNTLTGRRQNENYIDTLDMWAVKFKKPATVIKGAGIEDAVSTNWLVINVTCRNAVLSKLTVQVDNVNRVTNGTTDLDFRAIDFNNPTYYSDQVLLDNIYAEAPDEVAVFDSSDVDTANDLIAFDPSLNKYPLRDGIEVAIKYDAGTTLPGGLADDSARFDQIKVYKLELEDSTHFRLYETGSDYLAGTNVVDLTTQGSGTHTFYAFSTDKMINCHVPTTNYSTFNQVHSNRHILPNSENGGFYVDCTTRTGCLNTGSSYSFKGYALRCTGNTYSFGGDIDSTARLEKCIGGRNSFGQGTNSGVCIDCLAAHYSFGCLTKADGQFFRCRGGLQSFAGYTNGELEGYFEGCYGGDRSFGSAAPTNPTAVMRDCVSLGRSYAVLNFQGRMENCTIEADSGDTDAVVCGANTPVLYNCTLIASGTGNSVDAGSAINACIAHCRLNKGIGGNVTNLITTAYNVDDADIGV